jgi:transcriptional regulator with XRE-family HTH domain
MEQLLTKMGERLKSVREKYLMPGVKLSATQIAAILGSTNDKISNYERGISGIPNHILVALYHSGINPVYLLTGEGDVYESNPEGRRLAEKFAEQQSRIKIINEVNQVANADHADIRTLKAAAGKIPTQKGSK